MPKAEKIHVKAYLLSLCLLLAAPAEASEYSRARTNPIFTAAPSTAAGRVEYGFARYFAPFEKKEKKGGRGLASVGADPNAANRRISEIAAPGKVFMVQNSVKDLDDEVVVVTDKFEDGSVRVLRPNGKKAFVRFKNLAKSLSPETDCLPSHDVQICKGENVFYPARTSSLELPEAPVAHAFENGVLVVSDGADFVLDAGQVGKSVNCSPQKESVCVGDHVYAEGYRLDRVFNFEGRVKKAYTNGVVVVEADHFWKYPIDVQAVKKRIMTAEGENNPAVISNHVSRKANLPYNVLPEIEPLSPTEGNEARGAQ